VLHKSVTVSPWVAAVESMVKGHHGTVSKDLNVEKGELATKEKKTRAGTLQPAARVRVGSRVEISNPHPPRRQPARQTCGFAQPMINPRYICTVVLLRDDIPVSQYYLQMIYL
jgi:hypothetical protein